MYVCICNVLTDQQVQSAVRSGVRDAYDVHPHLGCETRCGRCLPTIADIMDAELNTAEDAAMAAE